VIETLGWRELLHVGGNRFQVDYSEGVGDARSFFPLAPDDATGALAARSGRHYPRPTLAEALRRYLEGIGAPENARQAAAALADECVYCVITGQQAGFLGGPAFTAYKIATAIRLAASWQERLGVRVVPIFWLASEDHDLQEINHAYYQQSDGEVGRVSFGWEGEGRAVADLPVNADVLRAWESYWEALRGSPHRDAAMEALAPRGSEGYAAWQARVWSELFAPWGLVVVEPWALRPLAGDLMAKMAAHEPEIHERLGHVAERLRAAGYAPALDPDANGGLFRLDGPGGRRVRVEDGPAAADEVARHPERFSADAALRPLVADGILPVLASVLGPGELGYQAMLAPLYDLLGLAQPVAYPRQSYTLVSTTEADRLDAYGTNVRELLVAGQDPSDATDGLATAEHRRLFGRARELVEEAYAPLRDYVAAQDPNLAKTWESTLGSALRSLEKLDDRALKAALSQRGLSKGELRSLRNLVLPRERLQERVYPLAWHLARHGLGWLDALMGWGELGSWHHQIVIWEDGHADL